jgi:3-hydroxyacyl-[acyl-carrier-protein] dehydratase
MPPELLFDVREVDCTKVLADKVGIEKVNPHRFQMMQLTAIVHMDPTQHIVIGYKDVGPDEFWVTGHFPGYPIMPGVIMCEAAAQLMSYYTFAQKITTEELMVFSGMENVRFRGQVKVGDRLLMVAKALKIHPRQITSRVQGFVQNTMVFNGDFLGIPFTPPREQARAQP